MPFQKGSPRPAGAGRKAGTPNKTTTAIKEALCEAFERIGGVTFLVRWAKKNPTEFYKLWVKTLPQEVNTSITSSTPVTHTVGIGGDTSPKELIGE